MQSTLTTEVDRPDLRAWRYRGITARTITHNDTDIKKTDIVREEHMVDALALSADEGRGHAAKCLGEVLATSDPRESEWGNPTWRQVTDHECGGGNRGN